LRRVSSEGVAPGNVAEKLTNRRLREELELQQVQAIMAIRALPVSDTSIAAVTKVLEDLVKVADKARAESLEREGMKPDAIATGAGSKRKVKRKLGMGDRLKPTKRTHSSLPSGNAPAAKRARV